MKVKVEIVVGNGTARGKEITFTKGKEPGNLVFNIPFKLFKEYEILGLDWEEKATRSVGKAATGAILGGALTGGLGLIAGAALGGKKKDASTAVITYQDERGAVQKLIVRLNAKEMQNLTALKD